MLRTVCLIVAACASLAADVPTDAALQKELERLRIPEKLTPKNRRPLFLVRGEGVQIYRAEEKDGKPQWVFQAPRALLLDYQTGEKVGTHGKGPVWVDQDGGKLTGKAIASAPAPNPKAVPWLLLEVKNENGGRYAKVTHIQRVDTRAGQPPVVPSGKAGESKEVRYHATYVFWGDR